MIRLPRSVGLTTHRAARGRGGGHGSLALTVFVRTDKAPVSKGLMGGLFLTCTAINVPLLAHMRHQLECRLPDMLSSSLFYRLVTSRLAFVDTKDLVCSALLIYYFRWVTLTRCLEGGFVAQGRVSRKQHRGRVLACFC